MLACSIGHDFSKIVTANNNFSHLGMKQFKESTPNAYDIFANIQTASSRATNLIRQLLTFSYNKSVTYNIVDLNSLIRDLLHMSNGVITDCVSIPLAMEPGLQKILGDIGKLEQVIVNLVVNASNALSHGGTITIETDNVTLNSIHCKDIPLTRPGRVALERAMDTGTGISKEHMKHIFDPFFTPKRAEIVQSLVYPSFMTS